MRCFVDAELKLPQTGLNVTMFFANNVNYLIVPELKKGQILHLSAGVTLRLYSGNRV